jgi:hypothetical protein
MRTFSAASEARAFVLRLSARLKSRPDANLSGGFASVGVRAFPPLTASRMGHPASCVIRAALRSATTMGIRYPEVALRSTLGYSRAFLRNCWAARSLRSVRRGAFMAGSSLSSSFLLILVVIAAKVRCFPTPDCQGWAPGILPLRAQLPRGGRGVPLPVRFNFVALAEGFKPPGAPLQ